MGKQREIYEEINQVIQTRIQDLKSTENLEVRSTILSEIDVLSKILIESDKQVSEDFDKQERRRIDEKIKEATVNAELKKQELTWGKVGIEAMKALAPLSVSLLGYNVFQKRILRFEETGRLTSSASRELHLPNFLKK